MEILWKDSIWPQFYIVYFPYSILTFIFLLYFNFYFPFLLGFFFSSVSFRFQFISVQFQFFFNSFSILFLILLLSHFGFLPNLFKRDLWVKNGKWTLKKWFSFGSNENKKKCFWNLLTFIFCQISTVIYCTPVITLFISGQKSRVLKLSFLSLKMMVKSGLEFIL